MNRFSILKMKIPIPSSNKPSLLLLAALFGLNLFPASTPGRAQAIYTGGHGDIGVGYLSEERAFEPHWHLGADAIVDGSPLPAEEEYEPGDLVARTTATRNSPSGLSSILGVADGTSIYALGSSTYPPNLGLAAEELNPDDWVGDITLSLTGWTLPSGSAEFALFTTNLAGTSAVDLLFSTFSPGSTDFANTLPLAPGDHAHYQWGFTEAGSYTLEFTWTGTHVTDGVISTSASYTVQVVPEPSAAALFGFGLAGALAMLRRRNRS
jgi:surface-anchored protein